MTNASNKIVDLRQRQANQQANQNDTGDRVGELLKLVRGTALKRIQGLVNTLFENIDDSLFDLAEKAETTAVQTRYFIGMRDVRKKRQLVGSMFQQQLSKAFNDFAVGKLQPKSEGASYRDGDLSLVEETDLEDSLAIGSTIEKAEHRLAHPLFALNQRLSILCGGAKVENTNNPLAPALLCQRFRLAVRGFEINAQARLIIYKLFDRYVMSGLDALYDEVNAQLVQAGVLPQIRHSVQQGGGRNPMSARASSNTGGAGAAAPIGGMAGKRYAVYRYDPVAAQLQAEIYNTLCSLLVSRRAMAPQGGLPSLDYHAGVPSIAPTELLVALTLLQNQAMMAQTHATSAADAAQIVQQIKQELLDQASKFYGSAKVHVAGADEDTIDLIGMLFEYILQDRNLPAQMQALLGRLQIPFLKVALLDKHLFAQNTHPARLLLDSMAQACLGWSEESDRDHRLHDKVKQTVESLLKEFDDDLGIFERTRAEFENFLEANKKRADLAEQRAAEATRGREKLHWARRISACEILKRVEGKQLPDIVHNVLTRPWANYLVLTLLRQGEDSNEWRQALRFADEFAWSALPKTTDAERTRLKGLLPPLGKNLRRGLAMVAYCENDVKQLMHELSAFYSAMLGGEQPKSPRAAALDAHGMPLPAIVSKAAATAAAVESPVEEEIVLRAVVEQTPPDADDNDNDDECLKQAKEMKVGTWVEFTDVNIGAKERAKLSWISPISSKYLFVNRKGLKVSDKTVFAIAAEIRRGAMVILAEVPLFDRALDAIVERLKAAQRPPAPTTIAAGRA
jgi:hypothetical protein